LNDGKEPLYIKLDDSWVFDTLEECCDKHYSGWNKNKCMKFTYGSGLWYASHDNSKCMMDCPEGDGKGCGGLVSLSRDELFSSPRSCCETKFSWLFVEFCEFNSLPNSCYEGTGLFYRGDTVGKQVCVRDCDPTKDATCGGLVVDSFVVLHNSATECCSTEYGWMNSELCAARSTKTLLEMYWPDKINSRCSKESEIPADDLGVLLFDSLAECCTASISWRSKAECVAASGGGDSSGTGKFYVDWGGSGRCVKDCKGSPPCFKLAQSWDDLYDTESDCCDVISSWIPRKDCVYSEKTV